jgi:hypothetical protein
MENTKRPMEVYATEIVNEAAMRFGVEVMAGALAEQHNGELHQDGKSDPKRAEFSVQELDGEIMLELRFNCFEHKSMAPRIGWRQDDMLDHWLRTVRDAAASRLGGES